MNNNNNKKKQQGKSACLSSAASLRSARAQTLVFRPIVQEKPQLPPKGLAVLSSHQLLATQSSSDSR